MLKLAGLEYRNDRKMLENHLYWFIVYWRARRTWKSTVASASHCGPRSTAVRIVSEDEWPPA